jgi:prophage maintenance system killer protein
LTISSLPMPMRSPGSTTESLNATVKRALREAVERRCEDPKFRARIQRIIEQDREPLVQKAAVLLVRLVRNHPLLDGDKPPAWVALRLFVNIDGWTWKPMPSACHADELDTIMLLP